MLDEQTFQNLCMREGEDFVETAYQTILMRPADEEGKKYYLTELNCGAKKEKLIFSMLTSEEGSMKNETVSGFQIGSISLNELLREADDTRFVKTAYIALLGRSADEEGLRTYLGGLADGSMDRLDVILILSGSPEGRKAGTEIPGLQKKKIRRKIRNRVYRIPGFGQGIRMLRNPIQKSHAADLSPDVTEQRLDSLEQRLVSITDSLEQHLESITDRVDRVCTTMTLYSIRQARNGELTTGVAYKKYEDEMRGSREEIIDRLKIYDTVFRHVKSTNGEKINALDLGCGRGEWLELAQNQYGVYALGVDLDESMLTDCDRFGLNAVKADLTEYIRNAASESVDIISMFQVAEHLPVAVLHEVLTECRRVLRKGGALIVETPNPENVIVGACNFYFDPTHVTKLPPALLRILVESAGLVDAEVVRMHEYGAITIDEQADIDTEATKQIARFFNNYNDYAVIAYKEQTET